jgi:hypothetical protein
MSIGRTSSKPFSTAFFQSRAPTTRVRARVSPPTAFREHSHLGALPLRGSFSHSLIAHQSESCRTFDRKHAVTSKGAAERQANGLRVGHGCRELLGSTELTARFPEYAEPFIWSESRRQFMLALRQFDVVDAPPPVNSCTPAPDQSSRRRGWHNRTRASGSPSVGTKRPGPAMANRALIVDGQPPSQSGAL